MRGRSLCIAFAALALAVRATAAPLDFTIDPKASTINVAVAEPLSTFRGNAEGTFRLISGHVEFDSSSPAATGRVALEIDATSYQSGNDSRDRAVTGSVLESDKYPTITFKGSSVSDASISTPTAGSAAVTGYLGLHGVTHPLRVPFTVVLQSDGELLGDGEVTFHYPDWGMTAPSIAGLLRAGDEATVRFHIVGVPSRR